MMARPDIREWEDVPFTWRPGQHVTAIAPTGKGKTTLLAALAALRRWVVVLATKPRDAALRRLYPSPPFHVIDAWPPPDDVERAILWPRLAGLSPADSADQRDAIADALGGAYLDGGWTLVVDELHHLSASDGLALATELRNLWQQGRSLDLSVTAATQRPFNVPLEAYSQASHLWIGRMRERRDVDRVAEAVSIDPAAIRDVVPHLPPFAWLYVRIDDAYTCITRPPRYPRHPTPPGGPQ